MTFERVGRYVVGPKLGEGGQGAVQLGVALGSGGVRIAVAVKRITTNDAHLERSLVAEAEKLARVHHANVIAAIDVVHDPPALVTTYVHGVAADRLVELVTDLGRRIPVAIAAKVACDVLAGLDALHAVAILHRDVTPDNVLVGADGVARLVDLGIAKAADATRTTTAGLVRGKPRYLAPELVAGDRATQASDVYAAGRVLSELLAGVERDAATDAELPAELRTVIRHACNGDPARRPATARAMAEAIEQATPLASALAVAKWLAEVAADDLTEERAQLATMKDLAIADDAASGDGSVSPRRARGLELGLVAVLVVGAGALGWRVRGATAVEAPTSAAASGTAATLAVSTSPPQPTGAPSTASTAPEATVARAVRMPLAAPLPKTASSTTASAAACDPPYVIDENGHTHFKRQCLR